ELGPILTALGAADAMVDEFSGHLPVEPLRSLAEFAKLVCCRLLVRGHARGLPGTCVDIFLFDADNAATPAGVAQGIALRPERRITRNPRRQAVARVQISS